MSKHRVTVFKSYEFTVGEKICIEGGPRGGDWEVVGLDETKVKLRCPVSGREFEWIRFCYFVRQEENREWPMKD